MPKSMLPSRREHRFQKISVSAIYLHFELKISSQSDLLDAPMALKTHPKRKSAPRRSWTLFGRLWGSLGAFLGALGPFWSAQGPPGGTPALIWVHFWKDLAWIWRSVRQRKKAFPTNLRKKSAIVSPYKRFKMFCAHAVKNHSTKTSGHTLRSGYWAVGTVAG